MVVCELALPFTEILFHTLLLLCGVSVLPEFPLWKRNYARMMMLCIAAASRVKPYAEHSWGALADALVTV